MDTPAVFLKPRLCGERFAGAQIPLELLKDFAALEDLIFAVAKWQYRQRHPDRQRLPRGFGKGVRFTMSDIEDGSAIPVICLVVATAAGLLPHMPSEDEPYFMQARHVIIHAVSAAEQSLPLADVLPPEALACFDRLGRGLRDGESIEFSSDADQPPARLTRESRHRLIMASSRAQGYTDEIALRGTIPEADQDHMTFELQPINGAKVSGPFPDTHLSTICEAFMGYKRGTRVLVQGIGTYNRQNKLLGIESVSDVSLLEDLDVPAQLDDMRALRGGWLDGQGDAPDGQFLDWLSTTFDRVFPGDLPLPRAYPTPEGGVQFEWSPGPCDVSLQIDPASHCGDWHSLHMQTHHADTITFDLNSDIDWQTMIAKIRMLNGESA